MSVRPVLRIGFLSALTVAIAALSFVVTTPGTTRADSTFNPASTVKLCNSLTA
jgi:hypothetical protein